MGGLERGDDAFPLGEQVESGERLLVRGGNVLRAPAVPQESVLGADARVVEPGGDGMGVRNLPVLVGEDG